MGVYHQIKDKFIMRNARADWASYRTQLTDLILQMYPETVMIVGAGRCNDIDLGRLVGAGAERCNDNDPGRRMSEGVRRVVLLDVDTDGMQEAAVSLPEEQRSKLELRTGSLTGISEDDMEVGIRGEKVIRLWTAAGCREMNKAHHIQEYLPDAWAIGDDEGGFAIICVKDETKPGIYAVSFSSLEDSEKIFAAPSPMSLS